VRVAAVIFYMDGVIIDTEGVWEEVRRAYVAGYGKSFLPDSQNRMMGMSTGEWSTHLSREVGVPRTPRRSPRTSWVGWPSGTAKPCR